ncbi:DNA-binding protein [Bacillus sp. 17376]|uniref:Transcriptional regulator n=1 Tax=Mesobacillus boroniphilus JCM 21738 TaxID=1294265 RepID=W4RTK9_9BACI|nr:helix-turn-helix transcriptional regulator [Mesobacillus boroniphilus]ESU31805.1 DNA-binding protein [Bacillus sp. 17376]GAE47656.1 transcriptional regulator [Mesobacillus boroniphilus JCM 21738]
MKNKVKQFREQFGLTQAQLGQRVNVSRQAINAIEKNKFDPSIWLAYDLAKFFNMTIEELFEFEESERK